MRLAMQDGSEKLPAEAAVVIVAAGRGERAGEADGPKQYRSIGGQPVVIPYARGFSRPSAGSGRSSSPSIPMTTSFSGAAAADFGGDRIVAIHGGSDHGEESTRLALLALRGDAPDMVLIHDAVRPFVDAALIDQDHRRDR